MQQDLFAFEILGGQLYLHADLGSGSIKMRASKTRVDDGVWHDVALRRVERDGRVTIDSSTVEFRTPGKNISHLPTVSSFRDNKVSKVARVPAASQNAACTI